jgi:hypothetical protein
MPLREKGAEALPGDAVECDVNRVVGEPRVPELPGDGARKHRADRAVRVADPVGEAHRALLLQRLGRRRDQLVVERAGEAVVLRLHWWRATSSGIGG